MTPPFWLAGSYSEAVLRHGNKLNSFWTTTACDTVQKRNVSLFDSKIMQVKSQLTEFLEQFCCVMLLCYWGPRSSSEGIFEAHSVTTKSCVMLWPHPSFEFFWVSLFLQRQVKVWKMWLVFELDQNSNTSLLHTSFVSRDCSFQHEGFEFPFRRTSTNTKATEVGQCEVVSDAVKILFGVKARCLCHTFAMMCPNWLTLTLCIIKRDKVYMLPVKVRLI